MADRLEKKLFNIGSLEIVLVKPSWKTFIKTLAFTAVFYLVVDGCRYVSSEFQKPKEHYSENYQRP